MNDNENLTDTQNFEFKQHECNNEVSGLDQKFTNLNIESSNVGQINLNFSKSIMNYNQNIIERQDSINACLTKELIKKLDDGSPEHKSYRDKNIDYSVVSLELLSPKNLSPRNNTYENNNNNNNINVNNNQNQQAPQTFGNFFSNQQFNPCMCNNSNSSTFNAFQNNNEDFLMFNFQNNTDYNNERINHRSFSFSTPVYNQNMPYNNGINYPPHTITNNPNDYFSNYKNNVQENDMKRNYSISEKNFNINNDNKKKSTINGTNSFNKIFSGKNGWFCSECKNFNFESILI